MFDGVHPSLGLGIAAAVLVLLPITFFAMSRWRKRHDENELQRLARRSSNPQGNPSWVRLAPAAASHGEHESGKHSRTDRCTPETRGFPPPP